MISRLLRRPFNLATQKGQNWQSRAALAAEMVKAAVPTGSAVADLGCGDQKMRALLPRYRYQGFDLLPQSSGVRRLDLLSDPMPAGYDIALLLGVLEYVPDVAAILRKVGETVPRLVVSHLRPDDGDFPPDLIREKGWTNVLPRAEFETMLASEGWSIIETRVTRPDRLQVLWLTERSI